MIASTPMMDTTAPLIEYVSPVYDFFAQNYNNLKIKHGQHFCYNHSELIQNRNNYDLISDMEGCEDCGGLVFAKDQWKGEVVCENCGLVKPLEENPIFHEESEYFIQYIGARTYDLSSDGFDYGYRNFGTTKKYHVNKQYAGRLKDAHYRLKNVNGSKRVPKDIQRLNEYVLIAEDYAHELDLMKYQLKDVIYIIKRRNNLFKIKYPVEDIILCICLYIKSKSMKPQRFSVYIREFKRCNEYNKTLYNLIKQKLDN
jgi:hypothetical protein